MGFLKSEMKLARAFSIIKKKTKEEQYEPELRLGVSTGSVYHACMIQIETNRTSCLH
jgi:hypothetical protein